MAHYLLIPGAGGAAWYWHRLAPLLRERGHDVVAVELPADDETAGLATYLEVILEALGTRERPIVVGQSMGALTAPLVAAHREVELLVLTAPMIPVPDETGMSWWTRTRQEDAARAFADREGRPHPNPFDAVDTFLHDLPPEIRKEAMRREVHQSSRPFLDPWPLSSWPEVKTRVVAGTRDRLFPPDFVRRLSRERLGIEPDLLDAGHLIALAQPHALAELLERYREENALRR